MRLNHTAKTRPEGSENPPLPEHLCQPAGQSLTGTDWLHVQASEWYESQSEPNLAIQHALAGKAWWRAAFLIDQQTDAHLSSGQLEDLRVWLAALPSEVLRNWPRLGLIVAHMDLSAGKLEEAGRKLDEIAGQLASPAGTGAPSHPEWDELASMLAVVQAELALSTNRLELALELAERALSGLPLSRPVWRALAAGWAADSQARSGRLSQACAWFARSREAASQAGSLPLELSAGLGQTDCLGKLGRVREALNLCRDMLGRVLEEDQLGQPGTSLLYASWANWLTASGQLEEALAAAGQAQRLAGEQVSAQAQEDLALARVYLARGEPEAARQLLAALESRQEGFLLDEHILRIDIELAADRLPQARMAWDVIVLDPSRDQSAEPFELGRLEARLLLSEGQAAIALARLQALHAHELKSERAQGGVETLVLLALAHQALDNEQACLDALAQALFLAAPQGWVQPFRQPGQAMNRAMSRLLYRAATQGIQPDFISQLMDRMPS